jgi:TonB family protein
MYKLFRNILNLFYTKNRLFFSGCFYVLSVMLYFTVKEFLIPKIEPVIAIDTKFALSVIANARQIEKPKEEEEDLKKQEQEVLKFKLEEEKRIAEEKKIADEKEKRKLEEKKKLEEKRIAEEKKIADEKQRQIDIQTVIVDAIYDDIGLNNPAPKYPIASKKDGEEGEVVLLVKINAIGEVIDVVLYKSSGYERLDNSAIYTMKSWRFIPAKNRFGDGVESVVKIPFVFQIK